MPGIAMQRQKAFVSLKIIVVGGSIGGLSAAYALQMAGHHVVLLEKEDGTKPSYGGLRSPPNMTRVLNHWGLAPILNKCAIKCPQFRWMQGHDGRFIGAMKIHEQFLTDLCADFLFIQHGDLHSILYDIAVREGVDIRYSSKVTSVELRSPSVTLADGQTLRCDLIVGADGPDSVVRTAMLGRALGGDYTSFLCATFSIPSEILRQHEDLKHFADANEWSVWLGHEFMIRASLVTSKQQYSMTLTMPRVLDTLKARKFGELWKWDDQCTLEDLGLDMDLFEPRIQKLFNLATHITATGHVDRPPVDSLVCEWGRVAVLGESAHPLQPNAMHSAALVIEDAETIGSLFSRIHNKEEIPRLLAAYEEIRLARGRSTRQYEVRKTAMLTAPRGSQSQLDRDATLTRATIYDSWDSMDEKSFREMWGDEMEMFEYDAKEKVDDWWTKWGGLLARPRGDSEAPPPATPTVHVSILKEE